MRCSLPPAAGLRARLLVAALAGVAMLLVAAAPAAAAPPRLAGAATHPLWSSATLADSTRELDMLKEAGANAVRVDMSWSGLQERSKGEYRRGYVDRADAFFAAAHERGIKVVLTFWSTPCWASSAPEEQKQGCEGEWWTRGVQLYPPTNPDDFGEAAAWVSQRWGYALGGIELWNEPNLRQFFTSDSRVADYAAMVRAAYPKIKAAAPSLTVLAPAVAWSDRDFVDAFYEHGTAPYFDGLSFRPFNHTAPPYETGGPGQEWERMAVGVPAVRDVMLAHGDGDKRVWFTEFGWSSCAPVSSGPYCVTLDQQAEYTRDTFRLIHERWDFVEAALVYNLRNKGTDPGDRESQMGLLFNDFSPKPSYLAFASVLAELAAAKAPPAPPPPADDAPVLTGLRVAPARVRWRATRRATVSFHLSEPASVRLTVQRLTRGQLLDGKCRAARRRTRIATRTCTRRTRAGSFQRTGRAALNRATLPRRLLRSLRPGSYRLVAQPRDAAGQVGAPAARRFRVAR